MSTQTISILAGSLLLLVLVGCTTFLAYHGTLDGQAVIGFFSSLSLAGIIGGVSHVATKTGANASNG